MMPTPHVQEQMQNKVTEFHQSGKGLELLPGGLWYTSESCSEPPLSICIKPEIVSSTSFPNGPQDFVYDPVD